jgi:hypothetical protein
MRMLGLDSSGSRRGPVAGCCDTATNPRVPYNAANFLNGWATEGLSYMELVKFVSSILTTRKRRADSFSTTAGEIIRFVPHRARFWRLVCWPYYSVRKTQAGVGGVIGARGSITRLSLRESRYSELPLSKKLLFSLPLSGGTELKHQGSTGCAKSKYTPSLYVCA